MTKLQSSSTVPVDFAWYFVDNIFSKRCTFWSARVCRHIFPHQWRNQLFISGGDNFHELSFDDVIVLIQAWYNSFANGHRYVLSAIFPKMRTY